MNGKRKYGFSGIFLVVLMLLLLRERIPVLCAGERPLAAYGIGTDADFLPEPGGPVLIIEIDHTEDT